MFCKVCGTQIPENAAFCPNCGATVENEVPVTPVYAEPINFQPESPVNTNSNLVMGILAIAFASSFWLSFMGIIFGAIGGKKAKALRNMGYPVTGKAKVGKILSKVGLILGIVFTVFAAIYIVSFIFVIIAENGSILHQIADGIEDSVKL